MSGGPINPFDTPGLTGQPKRPLCPWRYAGHDDRYVDVDDANAAFERFTEDIGNLDALDTEGGRLTLVTGESRTGKTALIHRCVNWVTGKLRDDLGLEGKVIDLMPTLKGRDEQPVDERLADVCAVLVTKLIGEGLIRSDAAEVFEANKRDPDFVYHRVSNALVDDTALVILLPTPGELADEVARYAALAMSSTRTLLFAESALINEEELNELVESFTDWSPPITPRVGPLRDGDAKRFTEDRLARSSELGVYPHLTQEAVDAVGNWVDSVGQLQLILHGIYDTRRRSGRGYDKDSKVTVNDIRVFLNPPGEGV